MKERKIIGISRSERFSPNLSANDAAIFNCVAMELKQLGHEVDLYSEKSFVESEAEAQVIFSMARGTSTLKRLKDLGANGSLVISSALGVENCIRKAMTELLIAHSIPHPISIVTETENASIPNDFFPCWIKRGDSHAMVKEDVAFASCPEEAEGILADFRERGIPNAVINEHLEGDLVKFYGVAGTDFFHWFYPSPSSHSKFGLEKINGEATGTAFQVEELIRSCNMAAAVLDISVYGGDCIILPNGAFKIIDFNDWPSFSPCRETAGKSIAAHIHNMTLKTFR